MPHTPEWHALRAEELTERAETLFAELDFSWPTNREKYDALIQLASVHAKLAEVLPKPLPSYQLTASADDLFPRWRECPGGSDCIIRGSE